MHVQRLTDIRKMTAAHVSVTIEGRMPDKSLMRLSEGDGNLGQTEKRPSFEPVALARGLQVPFCDQSLISQIARLGSDTTVRNHQSHTDDSSGLLQDGGGKTSP